MKPQTRALVSYEQHTMWRSDDELAHAKHSSWFSSSLLKMVYFVLNAHTPNIETTPWLRLLLAVVLARITWLFSNSIVAFMVLRILIISCNSIPCYQATGPHSTVALTNINLKVFQRWLIALGFKSCCVHFATFSSPYHLYGPQPGIIH